MEDVEQIQDQNQNNTPPVEAGSSDKPYNMPPNVEAAVAYLLAPVTSAVVLVFEKENKFVRFHAMQALIFGLAVIVAQAVATALVPVLIGLLLLPLVGIGAFVLWLLLMWKAYNNEEYEIPYLGKIARDQLH